MLKILFFLILFFNFILADNYYIVTFKPCIENYNNKLNFFYLSKFLKNKKVEILFKRGDFYKIDNLNSGYYVELNNNLQNVKRMIELLNKKNNLNNSYLLIFNPFEYIDKNLNISSCRKTFNLAWIESNYSPYKCNIFNVFNQNSLNGLRVAIIDTNYKNINYLEQRKCFYSFFFNKLGAKLTYYGNPHGDIKLVLDSFNNPENLNCKYFNKNKKILFLNNKGINFNFCQ